MTTPQELLVRAAARNNAEWCATMSRAHGLAGEFGAQAWAAPARTPLSYPDAVALVPRADGAELLARIDTAAAGASVKDSFADLDLVEADFRVLFEAQWIHRPAGAPTTSSNLAWTVVGTPDTLRAWALAWDNGDGNADIFRPVLLDDPATFVLAGQSVDGRLVAGAVASRSDQVVGMSLRWTAALTGPGRSSSMPRTSCSPPRRWSATHRATAWPPPPAMALNPWVRCGSGCTACDRTGSVRGQIFLAAGTDVSKGDRIIRGHLVVTSAVWPYAPKMSFSAVPGVGLRPTITRPSWPTSAVTAVTSCVGSSRRLARSTNPPFARS